MKGLGLGARGGALLAMLLAWTATGCSGVAYGSGDVSEVRRAPERPGRYSQLGIVPFDPEGYDPQIAGRVKRQFQERGYSAELFMAQNVGSGYQDAMVNELCTEGSDMMAVDGVVFATWDRLELYDCGSQELAYEVRGEYEGVDRLVEFMVRYFEGKPAPEGD